MTDFERIETAIRFLKDNFRDQPDLEAVARQVHLSPFHFQRLFKEWAGVSPKKFIQFLTVEYAKQLLREQQSLLATSIESGLSGTGRLHDLFITIEGMTPGEYKQGGASLIIRYSLEDTPFGKVIIASTAKGICHLAFVKDAGEAIAGLRALFPRATIGQATDPIQEAALAIFRGNWADLPRIKLHLKGTPFQLKVWQSLLRIPFGGVSTYAGVAEDIANAGASRAVGTAVAHNPVAFLIPCHRVIRSTGITGEYHWGSHRKAAMVGWEAARLHATT
jgi:AraC family transcriptional regulator of adaptative response/methylated-DNA-[protein]-cysteine methyltransferase